MAPRDATHRAEQTTQEAGDFSLHADALMLRRNENVFTPREDPGCLEKSD